MVDPVQFVFCKQLVRDLRHWEYGDAGSGKLRPFTSLCPSAICLVLSAGLLILGRFSNMSRAAFVLSLGSIIALDLAGFKSANLEL